VYTNLHTEYFFFTDNRSYILCQLSHSSARTLEFSAAFFKLKLTSVQLVNICCCYLRIVADAVKRNHIKPEAPCFSLYKYDRAAVMLRKYILQFAEALYIKAFQFIYQPVHLPVAQDRYSVAVEKTYTRREIIKCVFYRPA
jgi:hypothetical protein